MGKYQNPGKTAIRRKKLSVPMKQLASRLTGRVLDYGSGLGDDAAALGLESYDPNHGPDMPSGLFDAITCNYVLNTISVIDGRSVVQDIRKRLKPDGIGYVSVRSDVREDTDTQRNACLDKEMGLERVSGIKGCRTYLVRP